MTAHTKFLAMLAAAHYENNRRRDRRPIRIGPGKRTWRTEHRAARRCKPMEHKRGKLWIALEYPEHVKWLAARPDLNTNA